MPSDKKACCMICNKEFDTINHLHLRTHGLTVEEYLRKFEGATLYSEAATEKLKKRKLDHAANAKKGWENNPNSGRTGIPLTENSKQSLSEKMIGHEVSEETKNKISESMMGHEVSDEARHKMSANRSGKGTGEKSPEHREKIRQALIAHHNRRKGK